MKVTIANDFANLWDPLDADALAILEQNCLDDPKHERMAPVPLWVNGPKPNILLDCHHTHRIREKNRLKIKYVKLRFNDRLEALDYARRIQLGRRNLSESQRALAIAEWKKTRKNVGRPPENNSANLRDINGMAKQAGTSKRTMNAAVKVAEKAAPEVKQLVRSGKSSVSDGAAVADLPKNEQAKAVRKVEAGKAKTLREAVDFNPPPIVEQTIEEKMADWNKRVESFARSITALNDSAPEGGWWDDSQANITAQQLKSAAGSARQAKCDKVCPMCKGDGCRRCKNTGFMPKRTYEMAGGK